VAREERKKEVKRIPLSGKRHRKAKPN